MTNGLDLQHDQYCLSFARNIDRRTCGVRLARPGALADAKDRRCFENSDSFARDGCTEMI